MAQTPAAARVRPLQRQLPNLISVLRILLVPVWVLAAEVQTRPWPALLVLVAIGLSDVLDGWCARRWQVASRTGAILDAVADKWLQVVCVTWLALRPSAVFIPVPLWFLALLVGRDLLLGGGLLLLRARAAGFQVVHRWHGKLASLLVFALLVWATVGVGHALAAGVYAALAAFVGASTLAYAWDGWRQLRGSGPGQAGCG